MMDTLQNQGVKKKKKHQKVKNAKSKYIKFQKMASHS